MSMSTHIKGFRPPNEKWRKMKAVWDACSKAGTSIPVDVLNFFNGESPDERGQDVNIKEAISDYTDDMKDGYEIDITKLPEDVTIIRVYNSY